MKMFWVVLFCFACLNRHELFSIVTITHNLSDRAAKEYIDFSLTADKIDIFPENDDDFIHTSVLQPYTPTKKIEPITAPSKPLETQLKTVSEQARTPSLYANTDAQELKLFDEAVNSPSNPKEFQNEEFNLFSRRSTQLLYLPKDFNLRPNMFHVGPQFMSVVDYYVDNYFLTPGERYITDSESFQITILRKLQQSILGNTDIPPIAFRVTCPTDTRVEFDISEFEQIPTYATNTRAKGCVISMVTAPGWYQRQQ